MGIEYVDYTQMVPYQRAMDLISIIDNENREEISILLEDIRDTAIYFEEVIIDKHQSKFWGDVHRYVIRYYLMIPTDIIYDV